MRRDEHESEKTVVSGLSEVCLADGERLSLDVPASMFLTVTRNGDSLALESVTGETLVIENFFQTGEGINFVFSSIESSDLTEHFSDQHVMQLEQWSSIQTYRESHTIGDEESSRALHSKLAELDAGDFFEYNFVLSEELPPHSIVEVRINDLAVDETSWLQITALGSKHYGLWGYLPIKNAEAKYKIEIEADVDGTKVGLEVLDVQIIGRDTASSNVLGAGGGGGFGAVTTVGGGGMGGDGVVSALVSGGAIMAGQVLGKNIDNELVSDKKDDGASAFGERKKDVEKKDDGGAKKEAKKDDEEASSGGGEEVSVSSEQFIAGDGDDLLDLRAGDLGLGEREAAVLDDELAPGLPPRTQIFQHEGDRVDYNQLNPNSFVMKTDGNFNFYSKAGDDKVYLPEGNQEATRWQQSDIYAGYWPQYTSFFGGSGRDLINGFQILDKIYGGDDEDTISGGNNRDTIHGGNANDIIYGASNPFPESAIRIVNYHAGDWSQGYGQFFKENPAVGLSMKDWLFGGDGDDTAFGDRGNDTIQGDLGSDTLFGNEDNDTLYGAYGRQSEFRVPQYEPTSAADAERYYESIDTASDTLYGGQGEDVLKGYDGDDYLDGSNRLTDVNTQYTPSILEWDETDTDNLFGGNGNDELRYRDNNDFYDGDSQYDENNVDQGNLFRGGKDFINASDHPGEDSDGNLINIDIDFNNLIVGTNGTRYQFDGMDDVYGSDYEGVSDTIQGEYLYDTISTQSLHIADLGNASYVMTGDVDGDGILDVVVAESINNEIYVLKNLQDHDRDSDTDFVQLDVITAPNVGKFDLIDYDQDGDLDIIATNPNNDELGWYENDGTGIFSDFKVLDDTSSRHIDHINSDGNLDYMVGGDDEILVYRNRKDETTHGADEYTLHTTLAAPDVGRFEFMDYNGNGAMDIVTVNKITGDVGWYENTDGEGTYANYVLLEDESPSILPGANEVDAQDFDRDGDVDFIIADDGDQLEIVQNDGTELTDPDVLVDGSTMVNTNYIEGIEDDWNDAIDVSFADINGDGIMDRVQSGGNYGLGEEDFSIMTGFNYTDLDIDSAIVNFDSEGVGYSNLVYDFDLDGDLDVLHTGSYGVMLWENDLVGDAGHHTLTFNDRYTVLDAGDYNEDGMIDLLLGRDGKYHVWEINHEGTVFDMSDENSDVVQSILKLGSGSSSDISGHFADLNGDGLLDVVGTRRGDLEWYTGLGTFENGEVNTFYGNDGDDSLDAGFGAAAGDSDNGVGYDKLYGGDGDDTLYFRSNYTLYDGGREGETGGTDVDTLETRFNVDGHALNVDGVTIDMNSKFTGQDDSDYFFYDEIDIVQATDYDDVIKGNKSDLQVNTLFGNAGDDVLDAGDGDDEIYGGAGNDRIIYDAADDQAGVQGDAGRDVWDAYGWNADNTLTEGVTVVMAGEDNAAESLDTKDIEIMVGSRYDDDIFNKNGELDTIFAQTGDDLIRGGQETETIHGQDGDDTLYGGLGEDVLFGGYDNDTLIYTDDNSSYDGDVEVDNQSQMISDGFYTGSSTASPGMYGGKDTLDASQSMDTSGSIDTEYGGGVKIDLEKGDVFDGIDDIIGSEGDDTLEAEHEVDNSGSTVTLRTGEQTTDNNVGLSLDSYAITDEAGQSLDSNIYHTETGDIDGDGDIDIVVSDNNGNITLYKNNGEAGFYKASEITTDEDGSLFSATAADESGKHMLVDMDLDGDLDIVESDASTGTIRLYTNDGFGNYTFSDTLRDWVSDVPLGNAGMELADIADFDDDGNIDMLLRDTAGTGEIEFLWSRGYDDGFLSIIFDEGEGNTNAIFADVGGDGRLDIVGMDSDEIWWHQIDDATNFTNYTGFTIDTTFETDTVAPFYDLLYGTSLTGNESFNDKLFLSDLNSDGVDDLLTSINDSGTSDDHFETWDSSGSTLNGTFTDYGITGEILAAGDMDQDGEVDILFRNAADDFIVRYNQGSGVFNDSSEDITLTGGAGAEAALVDLNGDGLLDVLITDGDELRWHMSNTTLDSGQVNTILGGAGHDIIDGGFAAGILDYGDHNGIYTGGLTDSSEHAVDWIRGEAGDDTIIFRGNAALYDGGNGTIDTSSNDLLQADLDANGNIINTNGVSIELTTDVTSTISDIINFETIHGSHYDDFIRGDEEGTSFSGQDGDDVIYGGAGDDVIRGDDVGDSSSGNDTIDGGTGADILYGGSGRDLFLMGDDVSYIDTIYGGDDDSVSVDKGDSDNDRVVYHNNPHTQDMMVDLDEDNGFVRMTSGNQIVFDTDYDDNNDYTIDLAETFDDDDDGVGPDTTYYGGAQDTLVNIEEVVTSNGDDIIIDDGDVSNTIFSMGGDDHIIMEADSRGWEDYIDGGDGFDTLYYNQGGARIIDMNSGLIQAGTEDADIIFNIESVVSLGAGEDIYYGVGAYNIVVPEGPPKGGPAYGYVGVGEMLGPDEERFEVGGDGPHDKSNESMVQVIDIDGDGDLDVIGASRGDGTLTVYINNSDFGQVGFTTSADPIPGNPNNRELDIDFTAETISSSLTDINDFVVGDFNEDGHLDFVTAGGITGALTLINHDGTQVTIAKDADLTQADSADVTYDEYDSGTVGTTYTTTNAGADVEDIEAFDVDGDGDLDIVGQFSGGDGIMFYENRSDGTAAFTKHSVDSTMDAAGSRLSLGDVDNDGDGDIIASGGVNGGVYLYENLGRDDESMLNWSGKYELEAAGTKINDVLLFDLDQDGDLDILTLSYDGTDSLINLYYFDQDATGTSNLSDYYVKDSQTLTIDGREITDLHAVDMDLDATILKGDTWEGTGTIDTLDAGSELLNKGDYDILAGGVWFERKDDGSYETSYNVIESEDTIAVDFGDLNGDGYIDVVAALDNDGDATNDGFYWYETADIAQTDIVSQGLLNDSADGGGHYDTIYGGENDDKMSFRDLGSTYDGGAGQDTIDGRSLANAVAINLTLNNFLGIEVAMGGVMGDTLSGDDNADTSETLDGREGDDTLDAKLGNDVMYGNLGDDLIIYDVAADTTQDMDSLFGGVGVDTLDAYGSADKTIDGTIDTYATIDAAATGHTEFEVLYGTSFEDSIIGSAAHETIFGRAGNDIIKGNLGADTIYGGNGADKLYGGDEANNTDIDLLYGYEHDGQDDGSVDSIYGGSGRNLIYGGAGNDYLEVNGTGSNSSIEMGTGLDTVLVTDNQDNFEVYGLDHRSTDVDTIGDIITIDQGSDAGTFTAGTGDDDISIDLSLNNKIYGSDGDDDVWLTNAANTNTISTAGDADNISIDASTGNKVYSGADVDDLWLTNAANTNTISTEGGADNISIDASTNNKVYTGADVDDIWLSNAANTNTISTEGGADNISIDASTGNKIYSGADVDDIWLYNAADNNTISTAGDADNISIDTSDSNMIYGGSGADKVWLDDGSGNLINMDAGVDVISIDLGTGTGNVISGGADADTFNIKTVGTVDSIDNTYYGDAGKDTLDYDVASHDFIIDLGQQVDLDGGTDDLHLGSAYGADGGGTSIIDEIDKIEVVETGAGDDTVTDDVSVANTISTEGGDDLILMGRDDHDDTEDTSLVDYINGGANTTVGDTLSYEKFDTKVTIDMTSTGSGTVTIDGSATDTFDGIENLTGGKGDDGIQGDDLTNTIYGHDGLDAINAGGGSDSVYGGSANDVITDTDTVVDTFAGDAGDDTFQMADNNSAVDVVYGGAMGGVDSGADDRVDYTGLSSAITINLGALASGTVYGAGSDLLYGIEHIVGGSGADDIVGSTNANDNSLEGGLGNDDIYGGGDTVADKLFGGADSDRLYYRDTNDYYYGGSTGTIDVDTIMITGDSSNKTVNLGTNSSLTFVDIESVDGSSVADTIQGYNAAGGETLSGNDGFDLIYGESGNDIIYGGSNEGVKDNTTLESGAYESLYGQEGNDDIYGGSGRNQLFGEAGADDLYGGEWVDFLYGGTGTDVDNLTGNGGSDYLWYHNVEDNYYGGGGHDWVYTSATSLDANSITGAFTGMEGLHGTVANQELRNSRDIANFYLHGEGGNDVLIYDRDDTYFWGDVGTDYIKTYGNLTVANLTSVTSIEGLLGDGGKNIITDNSGSRAIHGYGGNDTLVGGTGIDLLYGGSGSDYFFEADDGSADEYYGGTENDRFQVTDADDSYDGDGGIDRVDMNLITTGGAYQANSWSYITEMEAFNFHAVGATQDIVWTGTVNYETVWGGAGDDKYIIKNNGGDGQAFYGNGGNDVFIWDGDTDIFDGGAGVDTIDLAQYTYDHDNYIDLNWGTLSNVEWIVGDSTAEVFIGDGGNNIFSSGGGDDSLYGGAGNDLMEASYGNDYLEGGSGTDQLYGSNGNDTFLNGSGNTYVGGNNDDGIYFTDTADLRGYDFSKLNSINVLSWKENGQNDVIRIDDDELKAFFGNGLYIMMDPDDSLYIYTDRLNSKVELNFWSSYWSSNPYGDGSDTDYSVPDLRRGAWGDVVNDAAQEAGYKDNADVDDGATWQMWWIYSWTDVSENGDRDNGYGTCDVESGTFAYSNQGDTGGLSLYVLGNDAETTIQTTDSLNAAERESWYYYHGINACED